MKSLNQIQLNGAEIDLALENGVAKQKILKVESSITIQRPISEVFEFVSDYSSFTMWVGPLKEVQKLSNGPVGVGSVFKTVSIYLGKKFEGEAEILVLETDSFIRCRSIYGKLEFGQSVTLRQVGKGTFLTLTLDGNSEGISKFQYQFQKLMLNKMSRDLPANLENLRSYFENPS